MLRRNKNQSFRFYKNKISGDYHIGLIDMQKGEVIVEGFEYPFLSDSVLDTFIPVEQREFLKYLKNNDPKRLREFLDYHTCNSI